MAIDMLQQRVSGEAGCILLDHRGRTVWAYNSQDMAVAYRTSDIDQAMVFTKKEAERLLKERE